MPQFEDLQALWQAQAIEPMPQFNPPDFRQALQRFGRITNRINLGKAIFALAAVIFVLLRQKPGPLSLCGLGVMNGGMLLYLVLDWRNQFLISRLDYAEPSIAFVRGALERIENYRNPLRLGAWIPIILVSIGYELWMVGRSVDHPFSITTWIVVESFVLALPFLVYYLGLKIRAKRFQFECKEVFEQLTRLQRELEDRAA